jgi:outer membrane murein-binding lipoprotein Lpp
MTAAARMDGFSLLYAPRPAARSPHCRTAVAPLSCLRMSTEPAPPKLRTVILAVAAPAVLMLIGAGCMSSLGQKAGDVAQQVNDAGNEIGNEAVMPVQTDVEALNKAKQVTSDVQAKQNEDTDRVADDLTVAMIVTENADVPGDATAVPGTIGCNDRVAYTKVHRETTTDDVLADALNTLLAQKDSNVNGMYNALWESTLKVQKIQSTDGVTTEVWLEGLPQSGGVCDDPRIKAQLESTISRLKPKYKIFLNGSEDKYKCIGNEKGDCSVL